uniref:Neur_chan_LBD domain-containing protein n=1 Tax=Globodera pallida TaxID=36090 RepID=A0A183BYV2_GLOPA
MRLILFILQILAVLPITLGWVSENRRIEEEILRNYDRRHRPVKQESTVTQVQMFLTVNHIEKVDQLEGTMLLHGILWQHFC